MRRLKAAVIGAGFMGRVHAEAIRRLGNVEVKTVVNSKMNWREAVADSEIDAVHICTPNAFHYPIAKAALESGKSVLCEKPLTMNAAEARELLALAEERELAHCTNHNLRFYPVVQQIRDMVTAGDLGEILIVNGTYFQDWLLYETDSNWRVDPAANGPLRAMGDVGSHWMDMIQHLTGLRISALCADLQTFYKPRPTEDFGAVLLRLGDRARGSFAVSQVSAGRKNRFQFEIFGTECGAAWNQERPDELWIGRRNEPNQILLKDPSLMTARAATFADLPGGHSEGYDDTFKQMFRRFYARVADPSTPVEYPTFVDGAWGMELLEKVLESSRTQGWVEC